METFSIESIKPHARIYFIGIGGVSMSALALMMKNKGFEVAGSDRDESETTRRLEEAGIHVDIGHAAEHISGAELVVNTAAVKADNPEMIAAHEAGIPVIERCILLGAIMKTFPYAVAVSGTHGKTTTTGMMAHILTAAGDHPTVSIGGTLDLIDGNVKIEKSDYFLCEACEYVDSFLKFFPTHALILNVDADHLDYFKDIHQIIGSFHRFGEKIPQDGLLAVNGDDANAMEAVKGLSCPMVTFGAENQDADYVAGNIRREAEGLTFDITAPDKSVTTVTLGVEGMHNILNATGAFALAQGMGIPAEAIGQGLSAFHGTHRRFQTIGKYQGADIIDDYAHHPTEIAATLKTARTVSKGDIWLAFQPHTYTRTFALLDDFAEALSLADHVVLADIFAAREKDTGKVHSRDLEKRLKEKGRDAIYAGTYEHVAEVLRDRVKPGDLIITMGAGPIDAVARELAEK